jgi:hypothetical protein
MAGLGRGNLPWLPLVRQETLILAGKDDPIIPLANARVMHTSSPTLHSTFMWAAMSHWSPKRINWRSTWVSIDVMSFWFRAGARTMADLARGPG